MNLAIPFDGVDLLRLSLFVFEFNTAVKYFSLNNCNWPSLFFFFIQYSSVIC